MNTETGLYKLFLAKSAGTEMLIPLSFMHWIGGSLPKKIFFRDRYLNLWLVKTAQVGENWYFQNGWEKFVKDNKIMRRYTLVFDYFEEDLFDIKVLGPNGRQTKGAGAFVSLDIDDETEDEEDEEGDREEVNLSLKREEDLSEESDYDDDEIEDDDDDTADHALKSDDDEIEEDDDDADRALKSDDDEMEDDDDDADRALKSDDDEMEDDDDDDADRALKRQEDLSKESESEDDETEDDDYSPNQEIEVEQVKKAAVGSTKRKRKGKIPTPLYPKYSGFEIFENGLAKKPANPHFVVEVKAKRTNDLFIPLPLVEEYKLDLPKPHMLLVDPHGREFHARYRRWTDGRILYTREWKFLLRRNNIVVGDTCICEFREGEKGLYLKVSFLRKSTG